MAEEPGDITGLLRRISRNDPHAADALAPVVYADLKRIAASCMRRERSGHTLQPTALVNEAFLRLTGGAAIEWQGRAHFFGVAARLMREVLLDYARKHASVKRDGGARVPFDPDLAIGAARLEDVLAIHQLLERLEALDPRQARIVELRFFAGLNVAETAEVMSISTPTVKREWASARAWLHREIAGGAYDTGAVATG